MPERIFFLSALRRYLGQGKPRLVASFVVCFALAAFGAYHFSQWHPLLASMSREAMEDFYAEMFLSIMPLGICLLLMVREFRHREQSRLLSSYNLRLDTVQKRIHVQEDLLSLVADYDSGSIIIFDAKNNFWYVNASAAKELKREVKDVIGQPLDKVLGFERSLTMKERLQRVRATGKETETLDQRTTQDGVPRFMRSRFQKINGGGISDGIMVREEDVTTLLVARERRESALRQVIATLVAVADRRDPFAAGHSARVGQLSRLLAEEMVLSEQEIETAEISGALMNFGKVLVPRSILTKTTALTPDELRRVRESILTSADILSLIEFSGDVVPTLRQVLERYDGTGVPKGLKENAILVTARIVAVANAFVALVSDRAHRPCLDADNALQILKQGAGKQYDQKVIEVLEKYIKIKGKQVEWLFAARVTA